MNGNPESKIESSGCYESKQHTQVMLSLWYACILAQPHTVLKLYIVCWGFSMKASEWVWYNHVKLSSLVEGLHKERMFQMGYWMRGWMISMSKNAALSCSRWVFLAKSLTIYMPPLPPPPPCNYTVIRYPLINAASWQAIIQNKRIEPEV